LAVQTTGRAMGPLVLQERARWLGLTNLTTRKKEELLNTTVVPHGLFGAASTRLFSHTHLSSIPKIFAFRNPVDSVQVCGSTLRDDTEPKSVCKMLRGTSGPAQGKGHTCSHIHIQLACGGSNHSGGGSSQQCGGAAPGTSGFPDKLGKECSNALSVHQIHRADSGLCLVQSLFISRESGAHVVKSCSVLQGVLGPPETMPEADGPDGLLCGGNTTLSPLYKGDPVMGFISELKPKSRWPQQSKDLWSLLSSSSVEEPRLPDSGDLSPPCLHMLAHKLIAWSSLTLQSLKATHIAGALNSGANL
ncbi:hypothetical protein GOODEAATRI_008007, partial [Goodea atripinnis]